MPTRSGSSGPRPRLERAVGDGVEHEEAAAGDRGQEDDERPVDRQELRQAARDAAAGGVSKTLTGQLRSGRDRCCAVHVAFAGGAGGGREPALGEALPRAGSSAGARERGSRGVMAEPSGCNPGAAPAWVLQWEDRLVRILPACFRGILLLKGLGRFGSMLTRSACERDDDAEGARRNPGFFRAGPGARRGTATACRKRRSVAGAGEDDRGPQPRAHNLGAATSAEQEAIIVGLRTLAGLSLDDITEVMQPLPSSPAVAGLGLTALPRAGLSGRIGVAAPRRAGAPADGSRTVLRLSSTSISVSGKLAEPGEFVFVAIERASRFA